jgi:hypothetical protein
MVLMMITLILLFIALTIAIILLTSITVVYVTLRKIGQDVAQGAQQPRREAAERITDNGP